MDNDWRYSKERMDLRARSLLLLGRMFTLKREVYEFCDFWVSQGNKNTRNIAKEFIRYIEDVEVLRQNEEKARKKSGEEDNKTS